MGKAYTFGGLQKHRRVSYTPERDDERIKQLIEQPVEKLEREIVQKDVSVQPNSTLKIQPLSQQDILRKLAQNWEIEL